MNPIYLFEAGGTKTTLLIANAGQVKEFSFPGFNPNRYSTDFEKTVTAQVSIEKNAQLFFYGSGLVEEANKQVLRDLFDRLYGVQVEVFDDVTGAARAMLDNQPGLIAILGTGGVAAYYDGTKIIERKGGHGYLIDDYGGGLELGKIILSAWLNGDLGQKVDKAVSDFVKVPKAGFIREFYLSKDINLLAAVVQSIATVKTEPEVQALLSDYFGTFMKRHVVSLIDKYQTKRLAVVGSIGVHFADCVQYEADKYGVVVTGFEAVPAHRLLAYHTQPRTI